MRTIVVLLRVACCGTFVFEERQVLADLIIEGPLDFMTRGRELADLIGWLLDNVDHKNDLAAVDQVEYADTDGFDKNSMQGNGKSLRPSGIIGNVTRLTGEDTKHGEVINSPGEIEATMTLSSRLELSAIAHLVRRPCGLQIRMPGAKRISMGRGNFTSTRVESRRALRCPLVLLRGGDKLLPIYPASSVYYIDLSQMVYGVRLRSILFLKLNGYRCEFSPRVSGDVAGFCLPYSESPVPTHSTCCCRP